MPEIENVNKKENKNVMIITIILVIIIVIFIIYVIVSYFMKLDPFKPYERVNNDPHLIPINKLSNSVPLTTEEQQNKQLMINYALNNPPSHYNNKNTDRSKWKSLNF